LEKEDVACVYKKYESVASQEGPAAQACRSCFEQQMFLVARNGYAIPIDCKYAWLFYVGSNPDGLAPHCVTSKDLIAG
jgi:hypothetical protein